MSEGRDPRSGDTISIPPDSSQAETVAVESGVPSPNSGAPPVAPTLDVNPGDCGPAVAHTEVAQTPDPNETVDIPPPSMGETLLTPSRAHSTLTSGGFTTDAGPGAIGAVANDETTDAGSNTSVSAKGRQSGLLGPAVPGYEIIAEIGRGGMGVVYKARHVRLDRLVALKMILAGAHASADQIARFHIEARAFAQIQHPGIVQIHEDGDHEGLPYFSLELSPGAVLPN
jgi:hypothetical protein